MKMKKETNIPAEIHKILTGYLEAPSRKRREYAQNVFPDNSPQAAYEMMRNAATGKTTVEQVRDIIELKRNGMAATQIAIKLGIKYVCVQSIIRIVTRRNNVSAT